MWDSEYSVIKSEVIKSFDCITRKFGLTTVNEPVSLYGTYISQPGREKTRLRDLQLSKNETRLLILATILKFVCCKLRYCAS